MSRICWICQRNCRHYIPKSKEESLKAIRKKIEVIKNLLSEVKDIKVKEGMEEIIVDIEENSFCLDPKKVQKAITLRTKAIIAVHLHGYPADMRSLSEIALEHDLFLLEDAAQAQGSMYFGKKTGSLGDGAAFSLEMSKLLTSGSVGGIMVTNSKVIHDNAMAVCGFERGLGWGLRGDVFGQAFAVSQFKKFETRLIQRQKNCEYLSKKIEKIPGVKIQSLTKDIEHNYYNFVVELVAKDLNVPSSDLPSVRKKIVQKLNSSGLPAGLWEEKSLPRYSMFKDDNSYLHKFIIGKHNRRKIVYDASKYPVADKFSNNHFYINGVNPPNGFAIMRRYADTLANILLEIRGINRK